MSHQSPETPTTRYAKRSFASSVETQTDDPGDWRKSVIPPTYQLVEQREILAEADHLKAMIRGVVEEYESEVQGMKEENNELEEENNELKEENNELKEDIEEAGFDIDRLNTEMNKLIGATLKFQFLGKKIKELLPDSAADDIIECFNDIEIPEVDEQTRSEFVVTETTDSLVAASTTAEDREYYGEDFYLTEEESAEEPVNWVSGDPGEESAEELLFSPVSPCEKEAAIKALEEGVQIDILCDLLYELGIPSSFPIFFDLEINSTSELRNLIQEWIFQDSSDITTASDGTPLRGIPDGISEEAKRVLLQWNQSLLEEESKDIYATMNKPMSEEQFTLCLESNEWPNEVSQITVEQFSRLQEWDKANPHQEIQSRSFVIDMNYKDLQNDLLDVDLDAQDSQERQEYLEAALIIQRYYRDKRRTRRLSSLRVRRRLDYKE